MLDVKIEMFSGIQSCEMDMNSIRKPNTAGKGGRQLAEYLDDHTTGIFYM